MSTTTESENETGIGIVRGGVREIRAHCIMDWEDVLTVRPVGTGWEFRMEPGAGMHLDRERMRLFARALLEATNE